MKTATDGQRIESNKSEEVQAILERIPTNFGIWVTIIVGFIILLMVVFGWLIKYPDIVTGKITITANLAPVKLIANTSGKLRLEVPSSAPVKQGTLIAYISNAANQEDVMILKNTLKEFSIRNPNVIFNKLKGKNLSLGELNEPYFKFINALQQDFNYHSKNVLKEQRESAVKILREEQDAEFSFKSQITLNIQTLNLQRKVVHRDSILYVKKVESESEYEKSKMNLMTSVQAYESLLRQLIDIQKSMNDTKSQIQQLDTQSEDKTNQVELDYISAFSTLRENLKAWEMKYCFTSPMDGVLQYMKFWKNDEFLQLGDEIFNVVPRNNSPVGQLLLPANGAGKVKPGQTVIIKLDDYPYVEFGSILGTVQNISLTTKKLDDPTQNDVPENYLVVVNLPNELKTNYDAKLDFKFQLKGNADIITKDKTIIERLFDNIQYVAKKE